jgi:hypothetical protein
MHWRPQKPDNRKIQQRHIRNCSKMPGNYKDEQHRSRDGSDGDHIDQVVRRHR